MRVLLDECVPRKFKLRLSGHDCRTVPETGFAGRSNGELLALAEQEGFHVFLTLDQGARYHLSLSGRRIAFIIVRVPSSRLEDLLPRAEECLKAIVSAEPGSIMIV